MAHNTDCDPHHNKTILWPTKILEKGAAPLNWISNGLTFKEVSESIDCN